MVTTTEPRATLTVEEAAAVLGIGRTLAFELARTGQLPTIRLGRRVLVPRQALDAFIAARLREEAERDVRSRRAVAFGVWLATLVLGALLGAYFESILG